MKIIVTAGGQGTKLWPYSRQDKPKQFQPIIGDTSSYQQTIQTLLQKFAPEDIFISTKRKFIKFVSEQSPEIPLRNYIVEPDAAKDTGPGHGLAFLRLSMLHPDEPFFLIQADCIRQPGEAFLQMIEDAGNIVAEEKKLLTGGIKATEPNVGVDYLQLGEHIKNKGNQELYEIANFLGRRKTYRETKELVESFSVVTHSNHYCWYPGLMLDAYKQYRPDWHEALMRMRDAFDKPGEDAAITAVYETMEKGSTEEVTRGVMEAKQSAVILLPFKWTDIGTWGSVYEFFADGEGLENYQDGNVITVETHGSLIKTSNKHKLVAVAGVDDLVIVDTDDALLVIPKHKIEQIKDIQAALAESGNQRYL
ncbi:MAG TPA: sugar phosphate nucleotidyltransferase [Candidatus Saccharimonadales bacterium]|nr:sugar phosphate nucleotidyltransferase [Candidatus Saccharimonadales bacterium]